MEDIGGEADGIYRYRFLWRLERNMLCLFRTRKGIISIVSFHISVLRRPAALRSNLWTFFSLLCPNMSRPSDMTLPFSTLYCPHLASFTLLNPFLLFSSLLKPPQPFLIPPPPPPLNPSFSHIYAIQVRIANPISREPNRATDRRSIL